MVDSILAVIVLILAGWAIAKNYDAKVVLFIAALVLLYSGLLLGHNVLGAKASTGLSWVDPFKVIKDQFVRQYGNAGLIILTLFGFAAYMSHIGANDMVIKVLTKPLSYVRKPIILIPMVFWVGTCLQIIIPSAASLAVILMATLFPVLRAAGMSTLTAAALIATTATIVPTPLGGDNVVAARVLGFDNVVDYVAFHLAPITIPALFVMGIVHYFWQSYLDKKDAGMLKELDKEAFIEAERPEKASIRPTLAFSKLEMEFEIASIKPMTRRPNTMEEAATIRTTTFEKPSPIPLKKIPRSFMPALILRFLINSQAKANISENNVISTRPTLAFLKNTQKKITKTKGRIGKIKYQVGVFFSGITGLITFISGSGNAVFYSFIELIPQIAQKAGIDPIMVALPMQCMSNLFRSMSPVAAVIIIVSASVKVNPLVLVKRTWVPLMSGVVVVLALSFFKYM